MAPPVARGGSDVAWLLGVQPRGVVRAEGRPSDTGHARAPLAVCQSRRTGDAAVWALQHGGRSVGSRQSPLRPGRYRSATVRVRPSGGRLAGGDAAADRELPYRPQDVGAVRDLVDATVCGRGQQPNGVHARAWRGDLQAGRARLGPGGAAHEWRDLIEQVRQDRLVQWNEPARPESVDRAVRFVEYMQERARAGDGRNSLT